MIALRYDLEATITPSPGFAFQSTRAASQRGEVTPASYIPAIAKEWHTVIMENNLEPTVAPRSPHRQGKILR